MSDDSAKLGSRRDQDPKTVQGRIEFLKSDLTLCFTLADLTATRIEVGDREAAEQSLANAEKGYATLMRFLSDPKHADYIDAQTVTELTERTEQLRSRLDDLQRRAGRKANG